MLPLLAVGVGVLALRRFRLSKFMLTAAGLIAGGFFGNFLDRVLFGYVVDMIYFPVASVFHLQPGGYRHHGGRGADRREHFVQAGGLAGEGQGEGA